MADVVSPVVRSRMMAGIRGRDTAPEILIRSALHRSGFRFRLHGASLPGRPDLVFPRFRAVVLINGCFWHAHECVLFKWPQSRAAFWRDKIMANRRRDERVRKELRQRGWRVLEIWECALRGPVRLPFPPLMRDIGRWLRSKSLTLVVEGQEQ